MTFFETLWKGIVQGTSQFISNDLSSYIPLFVVAVGILIVHWVYGMVKKNKDKHKEV